MLGVWLLAVTALSVLTRSDHPHEVIYRPHKIPNRPYRPHKITDRPYRPHKIADRPHEVTDRPNKIAYRPHEVTDRPNKIADRPHDVLDRPHDLRKTDLMMYPASDVILTLITRHRGRRTSESGRGQHAGERDRIRGKRF